MANSQLRQRLQFGPYVVECPLGHGGMGTVYRCHHERHGQVVAVKTAVGSQAHFQRLLRDELALLRRLGRVGHPSIVRILDAGSSAGLSWYAMEHVEGRTLQAYLAELWSASSPNDAERSTVRAGTQVTYPGRPPGTEQDSATVLPLAAAGRMSEVLSLAAQLARALVFIHAHGTSHGDLSLGNVLVRDDGTPLLIDFGVSQTTFAGSVAREVMQLEQRRTGTPGFLAPEVIGGDPSDSRCDLYAFGCILFELVAGRAPFVAASGHALMQQHLALDPPAVSSLVRGVAPRLEQLIAGLLEKNPRRRIGFAVDVVRALVELQGGHPENATNAAPVHLFRTRLVDRADALAVLQHDLHEARQGRGGCAFVIGESGIGKTRFGIEVGQLASAEGVEVVAARCVAPAEGAHAELVTTSAPLAAWAPALQALSDRVRRDPAQHGLPHWALAVLARYEPLLAQQIEPEPADMQAPPSEARKRVREALAAALVAAAQTTPLLVVIDDLHWGDELTLDFLLSAEAAKLDQSHVLLVGIARREGFETTLDSLAARYPGRTLQLERLSLQGVRRVVQDMLAIELPPAGFVESIYAHSEGNPLFLAELLKAAAHRGLLRRSGQGRWQLPDQVGQLFEHAELPDSLRSAVSLRLAGLDLPAVRLLALCGVLGREFSIEVLVEVCRRLARETPDQAPAESAEVPVLLDGLIAANVLERPMEDCCRFVHDKIREVALDAIPTAPRAGLHRLVARVCAQRKRTPGYHASVGFHWAAGERPKRAVPYLLRAAAQAVDMHAVASAIDLYTAALRQLRQPPGSSEPAVWPLRAIEIAEIRAQLLARVARNAEAIDQLEVAVAGAAEAGVLLRARLYRRMATPLRAAARYDEARHVLSYARTLLGDCPEPEQTLEMRKELIEIHLERSDLHYFADKNGSAMLLSLDGCAAMIERVGTPAQRRRFHVSRANALMLESRYRYCAEAVALVRLALSEHAEHGGATLELDEIRFELAFMLLAGEHAHCVEAAALLRDVQAHAPEHGHVPMLAKVTTYLALAHVRLAQLDEAERWALRASDAASESNRPGYLGAAYGVLAWVELRRERHHECVALARQATELWWRNRERPGYVRREEFPFQWSALLPLAAACVALEQLSRAQRALLELLSAPQQSLPDELEASIRVAASANPPSYVQLRQALALARQFGYM